MLATILRSAAGQEVDLKLPAPWDADDQRQGDSAGLLAQAAPAPKADDKAPLPPTTKGVPEKSKSAATGEKKPSQEPPPPPREPAVPPDLLASLAADRLANAPNMFGDSYFSQDARILVGPFPKIGDAALPLAGADRVGKIAENGNTLPQDRVYCLYNHFDHALDASAENLVLPTFTAHQVFDVDRYTLGVEKTLFDSDWSLELRMPFFGQTHFDTPFMSFGDGTVGNLAIIVKRLLYRSDSFAASIGLGIDTPTGYEVTGIARGTDFTIHNNAVHLMPFVGFLCAPRERFFCQGFLQVDVAANGNRIDSQDLAFNVASSGVYREQTLLYADIETGYWLYRNADDRVLTGLASVLEFHYTTTLQDAGDTLLAAPPGISLEVTNPANRVDMVNMTVGLHAELMGNTLARVAGVLPLSTSDNRAFDAEVLVQLERRF